MRGKGGEVVERWCYGSLSTTTNEVLVILAEDLEQLLQALELRIVLSLETVQ